MHLLNVLIYGPNTFLTTLNELKPFLKFNHVSENLHSNHDLILFHEDALKDKKLKEIIHNSQLLRVCATYNQNQNSIWDANISLPTTVKQINSAIENVAAKSKFNINSSIKVKKYLLDKNEKRLTKENSSIILTEKEIQLIELFLKYSKPISKDNILSKVWNYSTDADTHTVETHIYRLRKKIIDKFLDDKFIFNNKDGYYL